MTHLPVDTFLQGGKYKIIRFINSGGFGCTYEAVHVMLEKRVAIKEFFVKDFCNRDEVTSHVTVGTLSKKALVAKLRAKFIEEAKALCRLEHPGIVRVSDVFEENGTAYFVMKYIDGSSLSDIVKQEGPLPEKRALRYILQAAEALQYVHENNRLHLDIKPSNIMVDKNDQAILIDFGASKQYDEEEGENTSTLLGKTPGYAPLEQMGNDVVRFMPATDIYALGATLYKLLTGVTPLSANLLAIGEDGEPLPEYISEATKQAVAKAMEANKKKRPQSVADFIAILTGYEKEFKQTSKPSEPEPMKKEQNEQRGKEEADTIVGLVVSEDKAIKADTPNPENKLGFSKMAVRIAIAAASVVLVGGLFLWNPMSCGNTEEPLASAESVPPVQVYTVKVDSMAYTNSKGVTFQYVGEVDDHGVPHGKGKGIYEDNNYKGIYVGTYSNGLREGKANYTTTTKKGKTKDENYFEGIYKDDQYLEGKLTLSDGSFYVGSFKNNNFDTGKWYNKNMTLDGEMKGGKYL